MYRAHNVRYYVFLIDVRLVFTTLLRTVKPVGRCRADPNKRKFARGAEFQTETSRRRRRRTENFLRFAVIFRLRNIFGLTRTGVRARPLGRPRADITRGPKSPGTDT